jgi:serine/threonine protein kinase
MNEMAGTYQGRQFGNYRLLTLIGEGGSSEVYLGKHLYLGTEAAIKILDTRLKDNEFAQFSNEARTLINLHHPHIVRILDFGMEAGVPFIVMSYAPYGSLGQRHPVGTHLPLAVILSYVNSIAAALQYAHEKHLIHRDIKPDNLLIGNEHEIVLSDFGIAVAAHNTHSLRTQDAIGTVTYMAPEQLRKKARPASDQYALGVVVYEWLCGEPPFDGSPIEVAMQHLHDSPQPLREKIPDLAPAVEQVVLKALAKEPHQRFTSVQEFAEALEQASHAERETAGERPWRDWRSPEVPFSRLRKNLLSSPRKAALLALLLLVVLGAITGTSILSSLKHQPITTISTPRPTSLVHVSPGMTSTVPGVSPHATSTGWTMFGFDAQHTEYNALEHMLNPTNIPSLQTAWTSYTGYSLHPPIVANGVLYITTSENVTSPDGTAYPVSTLYALDSQTGKVLWKKSNLPVQAGGQSLYDDSTSDIYTVAVANGVVYAAAVSGMLDALDARTGAQIWSRRITDAALDTYQNAAPIVVNGTLYLHTINGNVYAVDARSGSVRWSTHVDVPINPRNGGASIPAEADGVVYVGGSQYLYALEARNGTMLWRVR